MRMDDNMRKRDITDLWLAYYVINMLSNNTYTERKYSYYMYIHVVGSLFAKKYVVDPHWRHQTKAVPAIYVFLEK